MQDRSFRKSDLESGVPSNAWVVASPAAAAVRSAEVIEIEGIVTLPRQEGDSNALLMEVDCRLFVENNDNLCAHAPNRPCGRS